MDKSLNQNRQPPARRTAGHNESPLLELLWHGQSRDNSRALRASEAICPGLLRIVETQIFKAHVENLAGTLRFDHAYVVGSSGRSGGLGLFWNDEINVDVFLYSEYHIDAIVSSSGCGD